MRLRLVEFLTDKIGTGFFVPDYAFLHSVAILVGTYLVIRQAERVGLEPRKVFCTCLATIAFALFSARLYIVLENWEYYSQEPLEIFQYWKGGLASFGALIGGAVAALVAAKWQQLPVSKFLDCCAPSVALATALSRVGCFLNGCCYGVVSSLPWGLRFPEGSGPYYAHLRGGLISPQQLSLSVHPTQLYESIYAFLLFVILIKYRKVQTRDGELFALLFLLYPLGRFFNEFLRGDDRSFIYIFSLPQLFSVVVVILAISFLVMQRKESKSTNTVVRSCS